MMKMLIAFGIGFLISTAITLYEDSLIEGYIANYCGSASK